MGRDRADAPGAELLRSELVMDLTWQVSAGHIFAEFARALRERRLLGLRCPRCERVYLPPRPLCGDCRVRLSGWVEVGPEGSVETATVVHLPITDPVSGESRPGPYAMGLVRLDGADTTLNHYLAAEGMGAGARVRPLWRERRSGTMADIRCFEQIPE